MRSRSAQTTSIRVSLVFEQLGFQNWNFAYSANSENLNSSILIRAFLSHRLSTNTGTRAEKTGNERSKAITNQSSKDQLGRLGNRLNSLQQSADAPVKSIKSDGRGGNLGDYENQAAESSTAGLSPSQNKIAYGACLLFTLFRSLRASSQFVLLHV